ARLHDAARFRARSTSHSVAARNGCTNIPLAAAGAQEDETILEDGRFRPCSGAVRPPGSARTDQVLEDLRIRSAFIVRYVSSRLPRSHPLRSHISRALLAPCAPAPRLSSS